MEKVKATGAGSASLLDVPVPPRPPVVGAPPTTSPTPATATSLLPPVPAMRVARPASAAGALDAMVDAIDGVQAAMLASVDGFGIARSSSMADEASHAAMLAAAMGLAHQLVAMSGGSSLRQLVVEHDEGLLVVWPIGTQRVLAVLASASVEQRRLRGFVSSHFDVLAGS